MTVIRQLWKSVPRSAYRRGWPHFVLVVLTGFLITTQAGAATVASGNSVTNFGFGFSYNKVPGHPKELYLTKAVVGDVTRAETVYILCHLCYHGHFTAAQRSATEVKWGTSPAILLTPRSIVYVATSAPGKIGTVKAYVIRPAPLYYIEAGYECTPPGVSAKEGVEHPNGVPQVSCPAQLRPAPLQLLYPLPGHSYSRTKPLTYFIQATEPLPSNEYFYVLFQSKSTRKRGCTVFDASLHRSYTQSYLSLHLITLKPRGLDSKGNYGNHPWCTGPASAEVLTDYTGDTNGSQAHLWSKRTINIY